jgi:hypothetical protein
MPTDAVGLAGVGGACSNAAEDVLALGDWLKGWSGFTQRVTRQMWSICNPSGIGPRIRIQASR